jgi:glutathione synthase/RimK-type ligase-like ATP-grasp enzyme
MARAPGFHCVIDRGVPKLTTGLLRAACDARGVVYTDVDARSFDFADDRQLARGDLLYRAATSVAAVRVEQFLHADGVASFHPDRDAAYFDTSAVPLIFQRAGLVTPRTIPCVPLARPALRRLVARLGGLPIVVKVPGGEGGVGVLRLDTMPALASVLDLLHTQGRTPLLSSWIPDATHWRVVVVGARAVAAYRNVTRDDDFRSCVTRDPADYFADVRPALAEPAIRAVQVVRREFGGVDLLEHPGGRCYLLEVNSPCYFAQAQDVAGIDIAGAMLDHLLAKTRAPA